jgi:lysophospholipase L1-like esterase
MKLPRALILLSLLSGIAPVTSANSQPVLVIIGASYAADWKQPPLPGYAVVNRGKGGEVTEQVLARFDRDVVAAKPKAVIIWGHINNLHRVRDVGFTAEQDRIKAHYREMVTRARRAGITPILATEVTLSEAVGIKDRLAAFVGKLRGKTGYAAKINAPVRAVNAWLRDYARAEQLQVLDVEKLFDDGEGFRKTEYTRGDGTHISDEGYAALTAYAQKELVPGRHSGISQPRP